MLWGEERIDGDPLSLQRIARQEAEAALPVLGHVLHDVRELEQQPEGTGTALQLRTPSFEGGIVQTEEIGEEVPDRASHVVAVAVQIRSIPGRDTAPIVGPPLGVEGHPLGHLAHPAPHRAHHLGRKGGERCEEPTEPPADPSVGPRLQQGCRLDEGLGLPGLEGEPEAGEHDLPRVAGEHRVVLHGVDHSAEKVGDSDPGLQGLGERLDPEREGAGDLGEALSTPLEGHHVGGRLDLPRRDLLSETTVAHRARCRESRVHSCLRLNGDTSTPRFDRSGSAGCTFRRPSAATPCGG